MLMIIRCSAEGISGST